jgi:uncharacterized protein YxeA
VEIKITRRNLFIIITVLVVLIAVPVTLYLSQQQQEDRSHASQGTSDSTIIETVDNQPITLGEVKNVALEQYDESAISTNVLKDALATLEERKILDMEAQKKGLTTDSSEVERVASEEDITTDQARYEVLRDLVTLADVNSVEVLSVGAWTPTDDNPLGLDPEDQTNSQKQANDIIKALPSIEDGLTKGTPVLTISDNTVKTYPSLADIIAVNGSKLLGLDDSEKTAAGDPQIIEFGDSNLDPSVQTGLFAMSEGEVKSFSKTEANSGGVAYRVVKKGNPQGAGSYDEWLTTQTRALVIPKNPL